MGFVKWVAALAGNNPPLAGYKPGRVWSQPALEAIYVNNQTLPAYFVQGPGKVNAGELRMSDPAYLLVGQVLQNYSVYGPGTPNAAQYLQQPLVDLNLTGPAPTVQAPPSNI